MKKLLTILLVLLVTFAVFANAAAEEKVEEAKVLKEKIRFGQTQILDKLIPYNNNTGNLAFLYNLYLDPMVRCDEGTLVASVQPALAESYTVSDDGLVYTFNLRKDIVFSNGDKMTSSDVVWSLNAAKTYSAQATKYADVTSIEAPDDYTVIIRLSKLNADFIYTLAYNNSAAIFSQKAVEADPDNGWLIGTGAYTVIENVAKDHVTFKKNPLYRDADKVKTEYIESVYITEASSATIALQTGEIDFTNNVSKNDLASFDAYDNCKAELICSYGLHYVACNVSGKAPQNDALQNIHFRRALNYATDCASIIALCCNGIGDMPKGVIPVGYTYYTEPAFYYEFNLEKAKEEMALSGVASGITLVINCSSNTYPGYFEVLKDLYSKIGVNLEITTTGTANNLEYDLIVAKYGPSSLQAMMVAMWTNNSSNRTKDFSNEALVFDCAAVSDTAERTARYAKLQAAATENACQIPLLIEYIALGVNSKMENYRFDPCWCYSDFRFAFCYE